MNNLRTDDKNEILTITINRPDSLNALNIQTLSELDAVVQKVNQSAGIRGVIITGEGEKAFVAGADIKELAGLSGKEALDFARFGQTLFQKIENCSKPVIAAINGFALGGGCELAMACHIRIASQNAKFGQPEVNLGIIPGYGGTQRLTQLVGRGKAFELMMTGDLISAEEAHRIGLVNHVVATKEELQDTAHKMMTKILTKGPIAIAHVIKSVNAGFEFESAGYDKEAAMFSACAESQDFKEGTTAFLEKRKPNFRGV